MLKRAEVIAERHREQYAVLMAFAERQSEETMDVS
jgi:hypothetical protein